jgi:hypothetical protein
MPTPVASTDPTEGWETYSDKYFTVMHPKDIPIEQQATKINADTIDALKKLRNITNPPRVLSNISMIYDRDNILGNIFIAVLDNPDNLDTKTWYERYTYYPYDISGEKYTPTLFENSTKLVNNLNNYQWYFELSPVGTDDYLTTYKDKAVVVYVEAGKPRDNGIYQVLSTFKFSDQLSYPIISEPKAKSIVRSPLTIIGKVPSGWMFEGQFPVEIRTIEGKLLSTAIAKEINQGEWSSGKDVEFAATLTFNHSGESGTITLLSDNPSGDPKNQKSYSYGIFFK